MNTTWAVTLPMNGFEEAFWQGAWGGVFQLVTLGLIAFVVNIVYQRYRELSTARQQLIEEIDAFTVRLYRPRKLYQRLLADEGLVAGFADPKQREAWRTRQLQRLLGELVEAIGRFRALQVKIVPLYGHHPEVFAYYLAIWRYLKEIRQRMERRQSLYFHHESSESVDAFYRLIDTFRYKIAVEKVRRRPPGLTRPPQDVLAAMRQRGDAVYAQYFESPTAGGPGAVAPAPHERPGQPVQ